MPDLYASFAALEKAEPAGSFRIEHVPRASAVALVAPHAGKIEPGTSEVCRAIASDVRTYYLFEGCKQSKNAGLHITSTRFDEPQGVAAAQSAHVVVAIHGQSGGGEFVNVGGRAASLGDALIEGLEAAGYTASSHSDPSLQGLDAANICNRGTSGQGVQLEISRGLRDKLVGSAAELRRFADVVTSTLAAHGL